MHRSAILLALATSALGQYEYKGPRLTGDVYRNGVYSGDLLGAVDTSDALDQLPTFDLLQIKSWNRGGSAATEYLSDGTIRSVIQNKSRQKMAVVKVCNGVFYTVNLYWRPAYDWVGHRAALLQDIVGEQPQFITGVVQALSNEQRGNVTRDNPIQLISEQTDGSCGTGYDWTSAGNFGRLGDVLNEYNAINGASSASCALSTLPSQYVATGTASQGGLACLLPCDPISPLYLEGTNLVLRQANSFEAGGQLYSSVYKLRARENRSVSQGGRLAQAAWLGAQCSGDGLYFTTDHEDPTWVVFWT
jgi:hypothetical protein